MAASDRPTRSPSAGAGPGTHGRRGLHRPQPPSLRGRRPRAPQGGLTTSPLDVVVTTARRRRARSSTRSGTSSSSCSAPCAGSSVQPRGQPAQGHGVGRLRPPTPGHRSGPGERVRGTGPGGQGPWDPRLATQRGQARSAGGGARSDDPDRARALRLARPGVGQAGCQRSAPSWRCSGRLPSMVTVDVPADRSWSPAPKLAGVLVSWTGAMGPARTPQGPLRPRGGPLSAADSAGADLSVEERGTDLAGPLDRLRRTPPCARSSLLRTGIGRRRARPHAIPARGRPHLHGGVGSRDPARRRPGAVEPRPSPSWAAASRSCPSRAPPREVSSGSRSAVLTAPWNPRDRAARRVTTETLSTAHRAGPGVADGHRRPRRGARRGEQHADDRAGRA